jgi:hypothetical protein
MKWVLANEELSLMFGVFLIRVYLCIRDGYVLRKSGVSGLSHPAQHATLQLSKKFWYFAG